MANKLGGTRMGRIERIAYWSIIIILIVWALYMYMQTLSPVTKPIPRPITRLDGGTITSTVAYPEQGRYYVRVRGDKGETETWEVSKGFYDRVILGAPINRRDNTNG